MMVTATRTNVVLKPNIARVLFRPFQFGDPVRYIKIIARILSLPERDAAEQAEAVLADFKSRHQHLGKYFLRRYEQVKDSLPVAEAQVSAARRVLIGAYFTLEYSLESAALMNPSIVPDPDQRGLPPGSLRFVISLRAVGEGHISSITFGTGVIDAANNIHMSEDSPFVTSPEFVPNSIYEKALFEKKLAELDRLNDISRAMIAALDETFNLDQLKANVELVKRQQRSRGAETERVAHDVIALAKANYEMVYDTNTDITERVIFPYAPHESNGIEDARFVRFIDENGKPTYYGTYTAYDGKQIFPQMVETTDFRRFNITTLNGPEVQNKGMALFPRKIGGNYAMISRQDGENIYIMFSEHLHFWYTKQLLLKPTFPWEFVQLGNCGSPIETDAGWLLLTHGVGPMRKYSIGAALLDKDDPSKVIGRTTEPILTPNANEREGYVPNVVYSCGSLVHNGMVVLPYAMSDYASSFALISLDELLGAMK
ncbi:MAG: glycoside hydrolase family 130 protein [Armatimonadetes bacterium]|nr:glycoside hydrolase family 130 protein [Armatimonadota bacterium]